MGNQTVAHSIQRGFEMAETLHHVSVVLLLVSLGLFLYNTDRAVAISTLTLVVPYLVAQLKQTDLAYSVWWRL